ncbi:MAG: hypothetical protein HYT72_02700 [Candidatus Aenigmarchaeota archaeon]|nr:hypothetical protein [Candidatus Aenigmarchaeota archaeon]
MGKPINFDRIFFHRRHYGVMLSVIFLVLLVGLAMLYQYQRPKQLNEQATTAPASALTTATIAYSEMCGRFPDEERKIPCIKAVQVALDDTHGAIQNVSIGSMRIPAVSNNSPALKEITLWLIDIKLENPYTNQQGEEVKFLRLGVDFGGLGIYRKGLK